MNARPMPKNEAERLAAVQAYRILDTAPEVEFDVTTRVASALFDAPITAIGLMDRDRLWFKSRQGLDLAEIDRDLAFCAYAIAEPKAVMVINDLGRDRRFDDNPLVYGPAGVRFYAGAPLVDPNGLAMGTLSVMATQPREFNIHQQSLMQDLAVSVMTAMEARHRALSLEQIATTDALTGIANRTQFLAALGIEIRRAQQNGQSVAVLHMDLDGFKGINDSLGHGAGDAVLREAARRIKSLMRDGETLARMGGDSFAVVMRAGTELSGAQSLAERIVEAKKQIAENCS